MPQDKNKIINAIQKDESLSPAEKAELVAKLHDSDYFDNFMHGVEGAGAGYVVSKFFKMSKPAQVLLSIAGFGIGKYLLDESRKRDKFLQYDSSIKKYRIND